MGQAAAPERLTRRTAGLGLLGAAIASRAAAAPPARNLYFLSGASVLTCAFDGSGLRTLCTGRGGGLNDGIAFDPVTRRLYWTNMGKAGEDDGFIESANLDGGDVRLVAPPGSSFTPKQLKIDARGRRLYWSDREGMRVMRCGIDGSGVETLLQSGKGEADRRDTARWCVGIALDVTRGHIYWTQKGGEAAGPGRGSIRRMSLHLPADQTPSTRTDVEVLFSGLPEPIDLDLDPARRRLYWTDRSDNTVSRAPMDAPKTIGGVDPARRTDREILVRDVPAAIGLALDLAGQRMAYTGLRGQVGCAGLDGEGARMVIDGLGARALATGIVFV